MAVVSPNIATFFPGSLNILIPGAGGYAAINAIKSLRLTGLDFRLILIDSNELSAGFYLSDAYYLVPNADSPEYIEKALEYWITVNETLEDCGKLFEDDLKPESWEGVPYQDYECGICPYYSICPSNLADKKRY